MFIVSLRTVLLTTKTLPLPEMLSWNGRPHPSQLET